MKKRLDTKLFSSGSEFLVMFKLLLSNAQTYKAYMNFEGYDLVCVNPKGNLSAKIQVKSKNLKKDTGFYLNKDDKASSNYIKWIEDEILIILFAGFIRANLIKLFGRQ